MSDMPPPPPDDSGWSSEPPPPPQSPSYTPQSATGWATLGTGGTVELASPGARLGARVLDWVIMAVGYLILAVVGLAAAFGADSEDEAALSLGAFFVAAILFGLVGIIYEVTFIATKGQTLGKMATNIKAVRADNGLAPGWGKSIGRWIIPLVLLLVPFVGFLLFLLVYVSLTWDRARQGWHDKAAGTLVIKV